MDRPPAPPSYSDPDPSPSSLRGGGSRRRSSGRPSGGSSVPRIVAAVGLLLVGVLLGAVIGWLAADRGSTSADAAPPVASTSSTSSRQVPSTTLLATATTVSAPTTTAAPVPATVQAGTPRDWNAVVGALGTATLPSDCPLPLDDPESLPNAARAYRAGVHEGIDFICRERGHSAVAALPGRVLIADNSYEEPTPEERQRILDEAKALGATPPWTLAMLFGRFVVLDHGNVPGAGHVVTIYAHLDTVDPAIRPGLAVEAGTRLGEVGNRGTESAGTNSGRPQAIHLHWEIHVDNQFLAEGADAASTRDIYRTLFGR